MSPVAEGWRRAGRPDGGLSLQPSLRGFDGDTTRCSRAGDTAWAPGCSAGRTAGSAGLPFLMESWDVNRKMRLRKNPRYWGAASVALESLDALPVENQTTALNLYLTNEVDWL